MTALVVIPSPTSEARGADVRLHRLAGEDAPIWLATGFCMLGALFALATGLTLDLFVAPPSVPPATALVRVGSRAAAGGARRAGSRPVAGDAGRSLGNRGDD